MGSHETQLVCSSFQLKCLRRKREGSKSRTLSDSRVKSFWSGNSSERLRFGLGMEWSHAALQGVDVSWLKGASLLQEWVNNSLLQS